MLCVCIKSVNFSILYMYIVNYEPSGVANI